MRFLRMAWYFFLSLETSASLLLASWKSESSSSWRAERTRNRLLFETVERVICWTCWPA